MSECKHELKHLVGMADGIHCKACGAVLKAQPAAEPMKKKGGKKNADK
jgi:hypothetical protein